MSRSEQTIVVPIDLVHKIGVHLTALELLLINLDVRRNVASSRAALARRVEASKPRVFEEIVDPDPDCAVVQPPVDREF